MKKKVTVEYCNQDNKNAKMVIPVTNEKESFLSWLKRYSNKDFSAHTLVYDSYSGKLLLATQPVTESLHFLLINPETDRLNLSFSFVLAKQEEFSDTMNVLISDQQQTQSAGPGLLKDASDFNFSSDSDSPAFKHLVIERHKGATELYAVLKDVLKGVRKYAEVLTLCSKEERALATHATVLGKTIFRNKLSSATDATTLLFSKFLEKRALLNNVSALAAENALVQPLEGLLETGKDLQLSLAQVKSLQSTLTVLQKKLMEVVREKKDKSSTAKLWEDFLLAKDRYHGQRLDLLNQLDLACNAVPMTWAHGALLFLRTESAKSDTQFDEARRNEKLYLEAAAVLSAHKEEYRRRDHKYATLFQKLEQHIRFLSLQSPLEYFQKTQKQVRSEVRVLNETLDYSLDHTEERRSNHGADVSMEGYLNIKRVGVFNATYKRYWVSVGNDCAVYRFSNQRRKKMVDLVLATVKLRNDDKHVNCFEIVTKTQSFLCQAESKALMDEWVSALRAAIETAFLKLAPPQKPTLPERSEKADAATLASLVEKNSACADCGEPSCEWVSLNLGVFLCIQCSGPHRSLGANVSKVRSLKLDTLSKEQTDLLLELPNNETLNTVFEATLSSAQKTAFLQQHELSVFIEKKYKELAFALKDEDVFVQLRTVVEKGETGSLLSLLQRCMVVDKRRLANDLVELKLQNPPMLVGKTVQLYLQLNNLSF